MCEKVSIFPILLLTLTIPIVKVDTTGPILVGKDVICWFGQAPKIAVPPPPVLHLRFFYIGKRSFRAEDHPLRLCHGTSHGTYQ
ncbi:hypothetical protein FN846DRAFT_124272 [Sphaerosporella brunnea]|uniref:Secreted protein n=1 Tax=Sphaerosporella brunnea TaxID=1250544 RepID=A0A5J5ESX6_9PEZI|nr:hypothetical protein FN846DRAFT_124272 [Sphaerosporella brunnea]